MEINYIILFYKVIFILKKYRNKPFEIIFPEFKISYLSMVKDELFITFPLPKGWSQNEVKIIAEDISTRI